MKVALISVHDKTGIIDFAKELNKLGFVIVSTSGTLKILKQNGIQIVKQVSEVTGFPEILEGRIKTLHPKMLAGILAVRGNNKHIKELEQFQITRVDLVVCNLYPFEKMTKNGADLQTAIENIDIGGPTIIRAAAKNFEDVVVVVNPNRYSQVLEEYKNNGDVTVDTRKNLAMEAFKLTARYDNGIWAFLEKT